MRSPQFRRLIIAVVILALGLTGVLAYRANHQAASTKSAASQPVTEPGSNADSSKFNGTWWGEGDPNISITITGNLHQNRGKAVYTEVLKLGGPNCTRGWTATAGVGQLIMFTEATIWMKPAGCVPDAVSVPAHFTGALQDLNYLHIHYATDKDTVFCATEGGKVCRSK